MQTQKNLFEEEFVMLEPSGWKEDEIIHEVKNNNVTDIQSAESWINPNNFNLDYLHDLLKAAVQTENLSLLKITIKKFNAPAITRESIELAILNKKPKVMQFLYQLDSSCLRKSTNQSVYGHESTLQNLGSILSLALDNELIEEMIKAILEDKNNMNKALLSRLMDGELFHPSLISVIVKIAKFKDAVEVFRYIDKPTANIILLNAIKYKREDIVKYLLQKSLVTQDTALIFAIQEGNFNLVKLLVKKMFGIFSKEEKNPKYILTAVNCRRFQILFFLIKNGFSINGVDKAGNSAFMVAVRNGDAIMVGYLLTVKSLDWKQIYNQKDDRGNGAVHLAAMNGSLKVLEKLKAKYFRLDKPNTQGLTPLCLAARENHLSIVEFFAQAEALPSLPDDKAFLLHPLKQAIDANAYEVARFLIEKHGMKPNATCLLECVSFADLSKALFILLLNNLACPSPDDILSFIVSYVKNYPELENELKPLVLPYFKHIIDMDFDNEAWRNEVWLYLCLNLEKKLAEGYYSELLKDAAEITPLAAHSLFQSNPRQSQSPPARESGFSSQQTPHKLI